MNSRIELLMAVARLQEEMRPVSDARITVLGVLSRCNPAAPRCVDSVGLPLAVRRRGRSSRSPIPLASAADHRYAGERGKP